MTAACAREMSPRANAAATDGQLLELAGQLDVPARHAVIQMTRVPQRGRRAPVTVDTPVAGPVERRDLASASRFGRVELPPLLRQQSQRPEHMFDDIENIR